MMLIGDALVRENLEGSPAAARPRGACPEPVRALDRPTLYTTRYGVMNYGHCLTDIVPRIVQASRAIPDCDIALHPQFLPAAREALDLLGVDPSRLVELDEMPTRLVHGLFASPCSAHPLVHSPRALELVRGLADSLAEPAIPSGTPTKLFVACDDAATQRITNYPEVESFLVESGFTPISVGALDLATQVRIFANAGEVIGIAGAAMTNLLFCAAGTRITVLAPASMPALHLWDYATQSGHDFRIGYFPAQSSAARVHANFTVDLDALASLLLP
jgi:capsular polysaccharide biosynthesis protein